MKGVAVVIVNYRTPELVKQCLASVTAECGDPLDLKVYVGDAESGDGSVATIGSYILDQGIDFASVFGIGVNGGFAYGNNFIIKKCVVGDPDIDYVHFLNPDTYVRPGAIRALVEALEARPLAGVAGSRLENPDGSPRASGFRFPAPWREFFRGARIPGVDRLFPASAVAIDDLAETRQVDWVTGASFMIPRHILNSVGFMDARYFLYFEETDLMSRIRAAGYEVWHVEESRVVHLQGQSTGVHAEAGPKRLPAYWYRSRFRFFAKRYGRARAIWANILFLAGDLVYRAHRLIRLKPIGDTPCLWRDMLAHGFSLSPAKGVQA